MDNLADIGTGTVQYAGIVLNNGISNLKNNIVVNAETDFLQNYCIMRASTSWNLYIKL